jgi:uncharacterized protein YkwD
MEGSNMKRIIWGLIVGSSIAVMGFLAIVIFIAVQQIPESSKIIQEAMPEVILAPTSDEVELKINEFRASKGLSIFNSQVPALDLAAQARAEVMCAENDWSHDKDWATLSPYYAYSYAGENLYYGHLQKDQAAGAVRNWVASPTHLANLVGNYSEIGVGVKSCPGFQNEPAAVIITNYFGVPR